jgi:PAS domain-containing protein
VRSPKPARDWARRPSFEVVVEAIPHMVWLADASGSTEYFNERGTEYAGLPRQANYGWEWVKLVHPHDAELARLG